MRKFILIVLFTHIYTFSYNQIIKGTILDKKTQEKIFLASVYFNGSFVGTFSDEEGYFELDVSKIFNKPLTISALGYYSITLADFSTDKPILIYLTPKVYEIEEVVIKAKGYTGERERNLRLFKENFLGTNANAMKCEIINENDITLVIQNDTLKAFSSKPLIIYNSGLGYKANYYLDKFWYCKKRNSFLISGNMIFTDDLIYDESKREYYEISRKHSYLGSRMHFFRALWENELESAGFSLKNIGEKEVYYNNIISQPDSLTKYLRYRGILYIYDHSRMTRSWITILKEHVFFDNRGYFDPFALSWDGEMAKKRIADWLPYEYSVE